MLKTGFFARLRRFAGWVWLIGGLAGIVVAIVLAIMTAAFIRGATEIAGKVVALSPVEDHENNATNYAPVFTYTANGRTYTITSDTSTNPPEFTVGETVRVLYHPRSPADGRLKTTAQLWMGPLTVAPIGVFLSLLGGFLLYLDRRYRRRLLAAPHPEQTATT